MENFRKHGTANFYRAGFGGGAPSYTPPPATPPAAQPATLASSSVAQGQAKNQQMIGAAGQDIGTSAQGVSPQSVTTGKATLGGVQ